MFKSKKMQVARNKTFEEDETLENEIGLDGRKGLSQAGNKHEFKSVKTGV